MHVKSLYIIFPVDLSAIAMILFVGDLFVGRVHQEFSGAQWEGLGAVGWRALVTELDQLVVISTQAVAKSDTTMQFETL